MAVGEGTGGSVVSVGMAVISAVAEGLAVTEGLAETVMVAAGVPVEFCPVPGSMAAGVEVIAWRGAPGLDWLLEEEAPAPAGVQAESSKIHSKNKRTINFIVLLRRELYWKKNQWNVKTHSVR